MIIQQTEMTESVMDQFEKKYKHLQDFRLIFLPMEASFPSPKEIKQKIEESKTDREKTKIPCA